MGQRASKELAKSAGKVSAVDPITGFSRGAGAEIVQDVKQREFLQEKATPKEMPPELIKFMKDVGPLKAPNLVKHTRIRQDQGDDTSSSPVRKVESMRLAEGVEGIETTRTTNFSSKADLIDPNDVGMDVLEMYAFLSGKTGCDNIPTGAKEAATSMREYLSAPVLMEETTDNTFVGVPPEKAEELSQAHPTMKTLSSTRAKLVLEDLWQLEKGNKTAC